MRRSWDVTLCLALVLGLAQCGGPALIKYKIDWLFVNASASAVAFIASDADQASFEVPLPAGGTAAHLTPGETEVESTKLSVMIQAGAVRETQFVDAKVEDGKTTSVMATWNGSALTLTTSGACGSAQATIPSEPSASSCSAPTTWTLDGITGAASVNWQYQHESGSGTLTFSVPPKVTEGETYPVSATFTASVTADSTRRGLNTVIQALIRDETFPGTLQVLNQTTFGPISPSASGSVTVTGSWTIPKNNTLYQNRTTLPLVARGGNVIGDSTRRVATYSRVP